MVLRFAGVSWTLQWLPVHNQHSWNFSGVHGFLSLTLIVIGSFKDRWWYMESVEKGLMGGWGCRDVPAKWCLNIERRNSVVMTCHCLYPDLGSDSDGLKLMFNKSEALPTSLFCCKACTGLCASVAGFEATINEFSRLKANLILVLKFQTVTWSCCSSALGRPGQLCFQNSQKKLPWKFSEGQTSIHSDWEPWYRCHQSP